MAVQADGKIVLGGQFTTVNGTARNRIARLNGDGSLESTATFNPGTGANSFVFCVAVQADGKLVIGGAFTTVNGTARVGLARLNNDAATQSLTAPDATQALWSRGGAGPAVSAVTFEKSTDGGGTWTALGAGTRVGTSANWQLTGLALPTTGQLRARGRTAGGYLSGSSGLIEQVAAFSLDSTTLAPTLTAPATSTVTGSPVSVDFTLPEAALNGSVTLSFGSTVLTLANSEGSAGAHSFTFNPANPTASAQIASGSAVADGTYTVTLSYQDALGNPAASTVRTNVTIDTTAPTFFLPANITTVATSGAGAVVTYTASANDDGSGVATSSFLPASGSTFPIGTTTVNASATDNAGNPTTRTFTVTVTPADPVSTEIAGKGSAVPGAGVLGSGIQVGAVWTTFGVPSVNEAGQVAFLGSWSAPKAGVLPAQTGTGIFLNGALVVKKGATAPGITNAVMSTFGEPLLGPDGSVAWIAALANATGATGAVLATDNSAIFLDADGAGPNPAVLIARKGAVATGAAAAASVPVGVDALPEWGAFTSVSLGKNAVAFTATMPSKTVGILGSPGPGGVTTLTDSGMWVYDRTNSTMALALREGNPLLSSTVKTIGALAARPGSPGQGRGLAYDGDQDYTVLRVTLGDARQALGYIGQDGTGDFSYVAGGDALGYGTGAKWLSFGLPTQNSGSAAMAFLGTVKPLTGSATALNNVAIFAEDDVNYEAGRLVSKGDPAGVSGGVFSVLTDPVSAGGRAVAFLGTMKTVLGSITAADNDGVWSFSEVSGLNLVAREGYPAAEAGGGVWKTFTSLALPEGRGPLFVASLINRTGTTLPALPGPGGITTANDVGLWATDSTGALRLLLQEGDAIGTSTVKTFVVLSSVVGSPAQTRSFNSGGSVVVKATDALGAQHLLQIAVP